MTTASYFVMYKLLSHLITH